MKETNWEKKLFYALDSEPNEESYWHGTDSEENFYKNKARERGWTTTDITYKFNEYGFRSKSFSNLEEDKNKFRILVTGCSHTMGIGNKLQDTWPVVLQNLIPNSVVYNLAQGGMSPDYCVRSVYKTIDIFNPDVVLVLWSDKSRFEWPTEENMTHWWYPGDDDYPLILSDSYFQDYIFQKNQIFMAAICKHVQYYEVIQWQDVADYRKYYSGNCFGRDKHFGAEYHKIIAEYFASQIKLK